MSLITQSSWKSIAPNTTPYPKLLVLMDGDAEVVLFIKEGCGVVVHSNISDRVGYYSERWKMRDFSWCNETISLTNE